MYGDGRVRLVRRPLEVEAEADVVGVCRELPEEAGPVLVGGDPDLGGGHGAMGTRTWGEDMVLWKPGPGWEDMVLWGPRPEGVGYGHMETRTWVAICCSLDRHE